MAGCEGLTSVSGSEPQGWLPRYTGAMNLTRHITQQAFLSRSDQENRQEMIQLLGIDYVGQKLWRQMEVVRKGTQEEVSRPSRPGEETVLSGIQDRPGLVGDCLDGS